jgi:Lon protease-like protein
MRYDIIEELPVHAAGYRRARIDVARYLADLDPPADTLDRPALLGALKPYFASRNIEADWSAIEEAPGPDLVTTLCMVCPFGGREKQALLEAADAPRRGELLTTLLRIEGATPPTGGAGRPV